MIPNSLIISAAISRMLDLAEETPSGCFVEFGVYQGGSAWHLADLAIRQGRECHLFDTFTGIPERTEFDLQHVVGDFGDTDVEAVKTAIPSAIFHVGVFPATMSDIGPIAFVHVDCDQYISAVAAIEHFMPLMVVGSIMLFDDYWCTSGVTKAVDETFGKQIQLTDELKAYIVKA